MNAAPGHSLNATSWAQMVSVTLFRLIEINGMGRGAALSYLTDKDPF
jgi:hypothetical protein